MNQRMLPTMYLIIGSVLIATATFNLFLIFTGRAWNCPQPPLVSVSRGLTFTGMIFFGVSFILTPKRPRISMALMVVAGLALILGLVFFFQAPSVPCPRADRKPTQHLSSHPHLQYFVSTAQSNSNTTYLAIAFAKRTAAAEHVTGGDRFQRGKMGNL
jgi:hypothetical protein